MCYKRNAAICSAAVFCTNLAFTGTDTIFQQSFRVFSLLPEVFNSAANNLVTIRQGPDASHMAGLAEVSAVSLPIAHYAAMEVGNFCFPWDFPVRQLVYIHYLFVDMHLWSDVDVILLSAWFRQLLSSVLQRQPGSDFSRTYNQNSSQRKSACPPLGQPCRIRLWHKWQLKREHRQ